VLGAAGLAHATCSQAAHRAELDQLRAVSRRIPLVHSRSSRRSSGSDKHITDDWWGSRFFNSMDGHPIERVNEGVRDALCVLTLTGVKTIGKMLTPAWSLVLVAC
jgi:hypothetical protein